MFIPNETTKHRLEGIPMLEYLNLPKLHTGNIWNEGGAYNSNYPNVHIFYERETVV
jgi:hypothetical protein